MSKSPEVRSDAIEVSLGGQPLCKSSGKLDLVSAVAEQAGFLVPFAAEIVSVRSRVRTACGTAAGTASLKGVKKGATAYASQAHDTTDAAGTDFEWTVGTTAVPKGEVLYWAGDGGATSTGDCDCVVTLRPAKA